MSKRRILIGVIVTVLVLSFLAMAFVYFSTRNQPTVLTPSVTPPVETQTTPSTSPGSEINITVDSWTQNMNFVSTEQSIPVYTLQKPSAEYAKQLSTRFNINGPVTQDNVLYFVHNITETKKTGESLIYNLTSGKWQFQSDNGVPFTGTLDSYLTANGLLDKTIFESATYRNAQAPDVQFVEYHRGWDQNMLPVVNPIGLLSLTETEKLENVSLDTISQSRAADENITSTSDNTNGLARQTDFNTLTVAYSGDTIAAIDSSILPIASETNEDIITDAEGYRLIETNMYDMLLTFPTGQGSIDLAKVYPKNQGRIQKVLVTEKLLAYVEPEVDSPNPVLKPYWIFRGTAQLESGYKVHVIATVSALSKDHPNLQSLFMPQDVQAGDSTLLAQQQHQSLPSPIPPTNTPSPRPEPTAGPTSASARNTIAPTQPGQQQPAEPTGVTSRGDLSGCYPTAGEINTFTLAGVTVGFFLNTTSRIASSGIYIVPPAGTKPTVDEIKRIQALRSQDEKRFEFDFWREYEMLPNGCPIRVTGLSPSLFAYGFDQVVVKPLFNVSYSDRVLNNGEWTISNGLIYYEYSPVIRFDRPATGVTVTKTKLAEFAQNIGLQLSLTPAEQSRLMFELEQASTQVTGTTLFIGVIPQEEVNAKLPLSISPKPASTTRLHFYVDTLQPSDRTTERLTLPAVSRSGTVIIEFGSFYPLKSSN